jgi:TPR repeat protein
MKSTIRPFYILLILLAMPVTQIQAQSDPTVKQIDQGLLALAKSGDAASQLTLANCYLNGKCAPLNYDEALVWYRKAAEGGNATAQFIIAWEYYGGSDIGLAPKNHLSKDPTQAAAWFRRAAEHADSIDYALLEDAPPSAMAFGYLRGEAVGSFFLGDQFEEGKDLPRDYSQAAFWLRRGADKGNADAQSFLGSLYADGKGVPQDNVQAARWMRKAAEQGQVDAEFNLSTLYFEGHGVVQNYAEARQWLLKAFQKGVTQAAFNLGVIYWKGLGVPESSPVAYFFFAISAAGGHGAEQQDATKYRDLLATLLTPEQLSDIQKKASDWFAAHPPLSAPQ